MLVANMYVSGMIVTKVNKKYANFFHLPVAASVGQRQSHINTFRLVSSGSIFKLWWVWNWIVYGWISKIRFSISDFNWEFCFGSPAYMKVSTILEFKIWTDANLHGKVRLLKTFGAWKIKVRILLKLGRCDIYGTIWTFFLPVIFWTVGNLCSCLPFFL